MGKTIYILFLSVIIVLVITLTYIEWLRRMDIESRTFYVDSNFGRIDVKINNVFMGRFRKFNETVIEIIPAQSKVPNVKDASLSILLPNLVDRLQLEFKIDTGKNFTGYSVDWLPKLKIGVFKEGENRSDAYIIYINRNCSWYNVDIDFMNKNVSVNPSPPKIEVNVFQLTYIPKNVELHIRCYDLPLDSKIYVRITYIHLSS